MLTFKPGYLVPRCPQYAALQSEYMTPKETFYEMSQDLFIRDASWYGYGQGP